MPNNITFHGNTDFLFGVGDAAAIAVGVALGLEPSQITVKGEPEWVQEGKNSYNITAAVAVADDKRSCDIQGIVTDSDSVQAVGGTFQLNGRKYIRLGFEENGVAGEYRKGTVNATSWILIT